MMIKTKKILSYEKGLYFKDQELKRVLDEGRYWFFDPFFKAKIDVVSMRNPWIEHKNLDLIVKSGKLDGEAEILDLKDQERALVWIEGRFDRILGPGLYALWKGFNKIKIEIIDASEVRFIHRNSNQIARSESAEKFLSIINVPDGHCCLYFKDGKYEKSLSPGQYLFWNKIAATKFYQVDMRECIIDVSGQEIMTSDKVTLRMNAVLSFRITDALKSISVVDDSNQALYREAQLAIRSVVGAFDLDSLLNEKDKVAKDLETAIKAKAAELGIQIKSFGIRDIILPGEMKDLMNKVIEARKAADANLIMRREETAAMRSQANTARLLDSNPTLMRLRELDLLEKVVSNSKMNVVLGEKGLADRIVNLL